jgi:hypothetical protein
VEHEFRGNYKAKTGREWLGYYPKKPPVYRMRPRRKSGRYKIEINSAAGHFNWDSINDHNGNGKCDGLSSGLKQHHHRASRWLPPSPARSS